VAILTAIIESLVALVLFLRFLSLGEGFGRALWYGVFHSVTAFNNAGFALFQDNFMSFSDDWVILGALSVAIIAGGLGLPVWSEIIRRRRTHDRVHRFSLHTRLTLIGTAVLLVLGIGLVLLFEWGNPGTLGPMGVGDKILNGGFQGLSPRTAGFNSVDYAQMKPESLMITDFLMFIGAGSVSTSGGIKVTTMLVLAIATIASLRGDREVQLLGRRLPGAAIRVALAVTVVFTSLIALGTYRFDQVFALHAQPAHQRGHHQHRGINAKADADGQRQGEVMQRCAAEQQHGQHRNLGRAVGDDGARDGAGDSVIDHLVEDVAGGGDSFLIMASLALASGAAKPLIGAIRDEP
jgi:Trk-type K+ transport system membrane component